MFASSVIVVLAVAAMFNNSGCSVQPRCHDVLKAVNRASAVFTGKVEAFVYSSEVALVRVKRVLKRESSPELHFLAAGDQVRVKVSDPVRHSDPPGGVVFCDRFDDVDEYEGAGRSGKRLIKFTNLRVRDTKVFLVRLRRVEESALERNEQDYKNTFLELDSEPLPINLETLDRVNAAVKDMFYKPRSPIIEEPCEKTYCAFGANCVMDSSGRAHCQCPVDCPNVFTPVCGTDGITYSNHCMLRKKSCQSEENTRVQHSGECGSRDTRDGRRQ